MESSGVVVLTERGGVGGRVRTYVLVDLVGHLLPLVGELELLTHPSEACTAVERHPAHDLRRREVPRVAAHFPDATVGLLPLFNRALDLDPQDRPYPLRHVVT